jgi:hypothetical protein
MFRFLLSFIIGMGIILVSIPQEIIAANQGNISAKSSSKYLKRKDKRNAPPKVTKQTAPPNPILTGIRNSSDRNRHYLIFTFASEMPGYKMARSEENDRAFLNLKFSPLVMKDLPAPNLELPLSHMELVGSMDGDVPEISAHLYLESKYTYQVLKLKNEIRVSFSGSSPSMPGTPSVLERIQFLAPDKWNLLMKYKFNKLPEQKSFFLSRKKDRAFLMFHNTSPNNPSLLQPDARYLTDYQFTQRMTKDSISIVKIIFTSSNKLKCFTREDDLRFFADMSFGDKIPEPTKISPPDTVPLTKIPPTSSKDTTVAASRNGPVDEKPGSFKKWVYFTLSTGVIVGGAGLVALYFLEDDITPPPDDNTVPTIESEISLPTPPDESP